MQDGWLSQIVIPDIKEFACSVIVVVVLVVVVGVGVVVVVVVGCWLSQIVIPDIKEFACSVSDGACRLAVSHWPQTVNLALRTTINNNS